MGLFSKSADSSKEPAKYAYNVPIEPNHTGYQYAKGDLQRVSDSIVENYHTTSDAHEYWANKRSGLAKWSMVGVIVGTAVAPLLIPALVVAGVSVACSKFQNHKHKKFSKSAGHAVDEIDRAKKQLDNSGSLPFSNLATALVAHEERMQGRYDANNNWAIRKGRSTVSQELQTQLYAENVQDMVAGVPKNDGHYFNIKMKKAQKKSMKKAKVVGMKTAYGSAA